jgi:aminoglycoside phosphotransferase (APT) family kinase protein
VTDVYALELAEAPPEWSGPLVLRVYPPATNALDVRRERCAQEVVAAQGVPAPRVVACEDEAGSLDAPFMLMERLPGRVQLAIDFPRVLIEVPKLITMHHRHAEAMRMVHRLDAQPLLDAFEAAGIDRRAAGPDHWLDLSDEWIERWRLDGVRPGLDWLRANRPDDPERLSINHGDFFGGNILEERGRTTGILDWNLVTVADAAFDVGGQMAVSEMSPLEAPLPIRLVATGIGQLLARGLRRAYPVSDLDADSVRYYAVMRAFTEMVYKLAAQARVRETGVPERMPTWRPKQCARYILDRTGVRVEP